jgi:outer membrane protein TolC
MRNLQRPIQPTGKLRAALALGCGLSVAAAWVAASPATAQELPQAPEPNPAVLRAPGGFLVAAATPGPMPLGIDDAIDRGMRLNLQQLLAQQNERAVHGELLTAENSLLPTLTAQLTAGTQEINLAALGFKPSTVAELGSTLGLQNFSFNPIVKVSTASAQINVAQYLFDLPAYEFYRAAQKATNVAALTTKLGRNDIALRVGTAYLQAIADAAQISNAEELERADEVELRQATLSHDAGVGTHLDVLRAQVQLQTQQQVRIRAEDQFAKDKIALNRLIGLPADQQLTLTDTVPFSELAAMPEPAALQLALTQRYDYLSLQAQLDADRHSAKAIRYQRLPTLAFNGFYGVLGVADGPSHGDFTAQGKLEFPIFQEGSLRGEREVADAQISNIRAQIANLRVAIDQQIRDSLLDVQSSAELVKVARSNVELSTQELKDATERFTSGVTDNLPVVEAQATLAAAQTRQVESEFQYNQSKLTLARNIGIVETEYKAYLGH